MTSPDSPSARSSDAVSAVLAVGLVEPLIPQNTGTIARLTAATRTKLYLVEPLGFELSDRYLKRAGLDYWPETNITVCTSFDEMLERRGAGRLWLYTTKADATYHSVRYEPGDLLVFGNETIGLSAELHDRFRDRRLRIPMDNPRVRSLNLSNAVSIVLYEARRQLGM